jgi:hypothetical protein
MTNPSAYNNANTEERAKQLRAAGVEEKVVERLSRTNFEQLPADVQAKLNATA